jgi:hypothetical protein
LLADSAQSKRFEDRFKGSFSSMGKSGAVLNLPLFNIGKVKSRKVLTTGAFSM